MFGTTQRDPMLDLLHHLEHRIGRTFNEPFRAAEWPVPEGVTTTPNDPATVQKAVLPYKKSSHILSGQYVSQPVWSPDGKQIAYISYDNSTFDLWLANINYNAQTGVYSMRGSPVQLTTGGIDGDSRPFWTP